MSTFEKPEEALASLPEPKNFKFEREDWALFRTVEGLQQKAGVPKEQLAAAGPEGAGRQRARQRRASPRRRAAGRRLLRRGRRPRDQTRKRSPACSASPAR